MDEFESVRTALEEVEARVEDVYSSVAKTAVALEAHPDTDYEARKYDSIEHDLSEAYAREFFYAHIAVNSIFLTQNLNSYFDALDEFQDQYSEVADELTGAQKEVLSGWQRDTEKRMQEIRPEITDINQEVQQFGLKVYTKNPSATPANTKIASD